MQLNHSIHLAYCTNIHRGETWTETFNSLQTYALAVREKVCQKKPFAIGLRLSERAAVGLSERDMLLEFRRWLGKNSCYVFTINGFPYGQFHGTRVKEQVYRPDWTSPERVAYTNLLFNLLAELLPVGIEGSVSTLPGSFKEFIYGPVVGQASSLSKSTGKMPVPPGQTAPPGYLTPVAYLWTRTVRCKNPSCGATVPLVKQTWLCKKKGRYIALKMIS